MIVSTLYSFYSWLPQECRGDLQPFRSHWLVGSRQIFYCISSKPKSISSAFFWKSQTFGQKTFEVQIVLLWGFKVNVTTPTPRLQYCRPETCFELQPFFAGPCPVLPSYDKRCKRCGGNEKMLILSPKWLWSDDVRWTDAMTDQNFKRVSDESEVCAVLTQNDPCVRYCADAFM